MKRWKRLGALALGVWWLFWGGAFLLTLAHRNAAAAFDSALPAQALRGNWASDAADAQLDMNLAVIALVLPVILVGLTISLGWIIDSIDRARLEKR